MVEEKFETHLLLILKYSGYNIESINGDKI